MAAFYQNSIEYFLADSPEMIQGILTMKAARSGFHQQLHSQTYSWNDEISILKKTLSALVSSNADTKKLGLLLEYPIARREKRIDAIVVNEQTIVVIEFKSGKTKFGKQDEVQLLDYCLDLRDFHFESREKTVIPLLLTSDVRTTDNFFLSNDDQIQPVLYSNKETLLTTLEWIFNKWPVADKIDYTKWDNSIYAPTPTIIEAARTLYSGKSVVEITRSHAGTKNLTRTSDAVIDAIKKAKENRTKIICFITGIPGAGKTLAGLNIAHAKEFQSGEQSLVTFLSGNGPLIKVLREVLSKDAFKRIQKSERKARKDEIERQMKAFIENVHRFIDEYCFTEKGEFDLNKKPNNQIIVFDEAQRAWNAEQSQRKFKRPYSEAEMLFNIMDRHNDWAAIVALVGGGQEINSGEAGLAEWGRILEEKYNNWTVYVSPELNIGDHSTGNLTLFKEPPKMMKLIENSDLHLNVSLRSYKAEKLSEWVSLILLNNSTTAKDIYEKELRKYQLIITRDLSKAKLWLTENCKGSRRKGLVASSGGKRLRAFGIDMESALKGTSDQTILGAWFLNPNDDVRSSNFLEVTSSEFAIQGLELDWACVCWDADLRREANSWKFYNFTGTSWKKVNAANKEKQQFILNKYRVLLTRAREGMIIWIPEGDEKDLTRRPEFYDSIFDYLKACGVKEI